MNLKQKLDYYYKTFNRTTISPDPLEFLHLYSDEREIELVGFISSVFAYGNVKQINNTLNRLIAACCNKPYEFIVNSSAAEIKRKLTGIKHRFYTEQDIQEFFLTLRRLYRNEVSLENLFMKYYNPADINLKTAIQKFSEHFTEHNYYTQGFRFMFPQPERGSACKRMNLFLRWMVRKDELDFGIWKNIPTSKLVIPVDTHIARICTKLKLTSRKNVSWKMAEEITENLKKFDPRDPVKYDFAICHIGMRKLEF